MTYPMLELFIWGSSWDLPSIDPACLAIITCLQIFFSDEWGVIECNNPGLSPTGELPVLKDGNEWFAGFDNIIKHLSKKGLEANQDLTAQQKAESAAFSALMQNFLYDAIIFEWYCDLKNFVQAIRPLYGKLLPLSVRYVFPIQARNNAKARLGKYGIPDKGEPNIAVDQNHKIYKSIRRTYTTLDQKLGEQDYFFGSSPTISDGIAYGYLALHLYPDLPNPTLSNILKTEFPQLSQFCDRMRNKSSQKPLTKLTTSNLPSLFSIFLSPREWFVNSYWNPAKKEKPKEEKSPAQIDFERKRVIAITGAMLLMVGYIIWNGIISIEITEVEEDDNDDETNDVNSLEKLEDEGSDNK
ncbi:hypothetical protein G9A89_019216 [Geosiphon pyriformis]|nr:hypothetical protein G9A89_019216 [Geosiphon pyriformis]